MHLLVLPLKVLVAGNDPLFSKETRGEIDVDSQVNHLAGNILYFYIFPQEINRQVNHLAGKFLHLVYRSTPVCTQMYTQVYTNVYTKGLKKYKCIHKYLHKYTQRVEKYT